jgi:hypothetical protein
MYIYNGTCHFLTNIKPCHLCISIAWFQSQIQQYILCRRAGVSVRVRVLDVGGPAGAGGATHAQEEEEERHATHGANHPATHGGQQGKARPGKAKRIKE